LDGETVRARLHAGTSAGEAVALSLRPEHIRIGGGGSNALAGTVRDAIYHGDHVRLLVGRSGGDELVVKLPGRVETPPPGSPVTLSFDAEDCLALPQRLQ
jgi:putative spermidine/putrescine transport system ATP-binding protein